MNNKTPAIIGLLLLLLIGTASAWYSTSYNYRMPIYCTGMDTGAPIVINGSGGFTINGDQQIVWTNCRGGNQSVYYNSSTAYVIANETEILPYEVEIGNVSSNSPYSVWTSYNATYHMGNKTNGMDSANHWNMTLQGGLPWISTAKIGGAFNYTSSSTYMDMIWVNLTNRNITLNTWINTRNGFSTNYMFSQRQSGTTDRSLYFRMDAGKITLSFYGDDLTANTTLNNNTWYNVIAVFDKTTGKQIIYLNGVQDGIRDSGDYKGISGSTTIGAYPGGGLGMNGSIDEFRMSETTPTTANANQTYQNGIGAAGYGTLGASEAPPVSWNGTQTCSADTTVTYINYTKPNAVGFSGALDYSKSVMTTATGNTETFGLMLIGTVFVIFYIIGSRYTQERALVYSTFMTVVVGFLMVSGNYLGPQWLILLIIALLASVYLANRVG